MGRIVVKIEPRDVVVKLFEFVGFLLGQRYTKPGLQAEKNRQAFSGTSNKFAFETEINKIKLSILFAFYFFN